jgi:hypothetical protein
MKTPSRKELKAAIDQQGISRVLMTKRSALTPKQRKFAENVALGNTGADSYRLAYNSKGKPATVGNHASQLKADDRIKNEILAYQLAIESQKYQSAANIRALVVQSLVQVLIDPESSPSHRISAGKVLGSISEIGMFVDRKEITHVQASDDIRQTIMQQLKTIASDATDVDIDANDLLRDLIGDENGANAGDSADDAILASGDPTATPCPEAAIEPHLCTLHTIPLKQSQQNTDSPIPSEDPPSSSQIDNAEGNIISDDDAFIALYGKLPPCSDKGE